MLTGLKFRRWEHWHVGGPKPTSPCSFVECRFAGWQQWFMQKICPAEALAAPNRPSRWGLTLATTLEYVDTVKFQLRQCRRVGTAYTGDLFSSASSSSTCGTGHADRTRFLEAPSLGQIRGLGRVLRSSLPEVSRQTLKPKRENSEG
jgi:hypothetical protein